MKAKIIYQNDINRLDDIYKDASHRSFEKMIRELGLPDEMVAESVEKYKYEVSLVNEYYCLPPRISKDQEIGLFPSYDIKRERDRDLFPSDPNWRGYFGSQEWADALKQKVRDVLGLTDWRIEGTLDREIKLPLFRLHSPKVKGSEVIYEESITRESETSFQITVFGTGLGSTRTVAISYTSSFTSTNGDYKVVYIPVIVRTNLIGIYKKKARVGDSLQTEMVLDRDQRELPIGIDKVSREEYLKGVNIDDTSSTPFRLAGDPTKTVQSFKESLKFTEAFNYKLGLEAFQLKVEFTARIKQEKSVALEFKLPSGRDYRLKKLTGGYGLLWEVQNRSNDKKKTLLS